MAVEGRFSTLLLRDCKGKAAAHSLEMSGSVFLRTCHPSGFTSRKKRRVCLEVLSKGLARAGVAAIRHPSLPLHPRWVRVMNCLPKISTQLPVHKGAEGWHQGHPLPDTNTMFWKLGRQRCCGEHPAINPKHAGLGFPHHCPRSALRCHSNTFAG